MSWRVAGTVCTVGVACGWNVEGKRGTHCLSWAEEEDDEDEMHIIDDSRGMMIS